MFLTDLRKQIDNIIESCTDGDTQDITVMVGGEPFKIMFIDFEEDIYATDKDKMTVKIYTTRVK